MIGHQFMETAVLGMKCPRERILFNGYPLLRACPRNEMELSFVFIGSYAIEAYPSYGM
jgi:hypothetical protein